MDEDFDFKLIDEFLGYNSSRDKTTLFPNYLIRGSKNVYIKKSGTVASRPGLKRRGSADSTSAGVTSSYEWNTSVGTERPLRVANGKLEVESDILTPGTYIWYELFGSGAPTTSLASTLTRWVFDSWWDAVEKTDRLVSVRGDDKIFSWSGGIAVIDSVTATTITKKGTDTWAQLGFATNLADEKKIVINGVTYTYTGGETTLTLTGIDVDPTSDVSEDDVAIQAVIEYDNEPLDGYEADFLLVIENQIWVGSYKSRAVYVSANFVGDGLFDFENASAHVPGDPDVVILDSPARGIGVKDGLVYIFAGNSDLYIIEPNVNVTFSYTDLDGQTRLSYMKVDKKALAGLNSALGHEFIGNIGDALVWLDQKNQLRAIDTYTNNSAIKPVHLSLGIEQELVEDDFTGGHLRVIEDTVYITAPNNGRDWMYQIREIVGDDGQVHTQRIWQPPQIRSIQRFAVISGVIYGHSNVNPQIYQVWDTLQWYDDNPNDEPIPYTCRMILPYQQYGKRWGLLSLDKYYFEGYMYPGVNLYANIYFDYQGSSRVQQKTINSLDAQARFELGTTPPSIGASSLGDNPLGDGILPEGGEQETLPKFRTMVDVEKWNHFEHAIEIYSEEADSRWEILVLGPNIIHADEEATFIRK